MKIKILKFVLFFVTIFFPIKSFAIQIMPECGVEYACNFCDFITLINNIMNAFIYLSIPICLLLFAWIGWDLIVAENKSSAVTQAKTRLASLGKGLFWILTPYLLVTTITSALLEEDIANTITGNYTCEQGAELNSIDESSDETDEETGTECTEETGTEECTESTTSTTDQSIEDVTSDDVSATVGSTSSDESTSGYAETTFEENGIEVVSTDSCSDPNISTCTSLEGMQDDTVDGIVNLATGCGTSCDVTVTGGTETGHTDAHSEGSKVDISDNDASFNSFMESLVAGTTAESTDVGPKYSNVEYNGVTYTIIEEGDHWDIEVEG